MGIAREGRARVRKFRLAVAGMSADDRKMFMGLVDKIVKGRKK